MHRYVDGSDKNKLLQQKLRYPQLWITFHLKMLLRKSFFKKPRVLREKRIANEESGLVYLANHGYAAKLIND